MMSDEDRLAELLFDWEERYERGEDVTAAELCPDRPDLAPVLAERIAALRRTAWMNRPAGDHEDGPPPSDNLLPGLLGGRYRLAERIGQGGHGRVYRGFDVQLQRTVAVKLPRRDFYLVRPDRREAFIDEARRLAHFSYPGIVRVYDVGRHDGQDFIVSEWIDGIDLARLISLGDVPVREAAQVVAEVARHLHHAHVRGFVHRDVKPANVLIQKDMRVVVTDFGIAARAGGLGRESGATGTISYMAPERLRGEDEADARSDVYGLGVVLYELLTGRPPFAGSSDDQLRCAILNGSWTDPKQRIVEEHYPTLFAVCRKCMATNPAARYQTAGAVATYLGYLLADSNNELDSAKPTSLAGRSHSASNEDQRIAQIIQSAVAQPDRGVPTAEALRELVEQHEIKVTPAADAIIDLVLHRATQSRVRRPSGGERRAEENRTPDVEYEHHLRRRIHALNEVRWLKANPAERRARPTGREGLDDEHTFLQAMRATPNDLALRLLFADWLEDQGDRRSELVRLTHILTQPVDVPRRPELEAWLRELVADGVRPIGPFLTNGIGMTFAWIPPGVLLMGGPPDEEGRCEWEHRYRVTLEKGFWMGVNLVTESQWREVMGEGPDNGDGLPVTLGDRGGGRFVAKLSELDGRFYRFPTEVEWEYACRAGTTSAFYFGDSMTPEQANYSGTGPTRVGMYPANAFGLHDMHGNLWEWCVGSSGWKYAVRDAVDAQDCVDDLLDDYRSRRRSWSHWSQRGGSWKDPAELCRSAFGDGEIYYNSYSERGLRICFSNGWT